jgi:polyisoprenoid-binding protein YceI
MNIRGVMIGAALCGVAGMAALAPRGASAPAADTFKVDGGHSSVIFRIKHNNVANFYGRLDGVSGTVNIDEADPSASSMEVEIKTDSVNSGNEKRNSHIKSKDFFDSAKFPTATFKSKSFAKAGDSAYDVTGDLTLHGVTKPITVRLEKTGSAATERGELAGYETRFSFKRTDFDMPFMVGALGDEVGMIISLEVKK